MVESSREILTKRRNQVFYKPIDVHSVKNAVENNISSTSNIIIHLPFSSNRWTSTEIVSLELLAKLLTLSKHENIILNYNIILNRVVLSKYDFWLAWKCYGIPCFHFLYFCLELTIRKDIWTKATSVTVMVIFWKCQSDSCLITPIFKLRSQ